MTRRQAHHARVRPAGVLPRDALRHLRERRLRTSEHWTEVWREEHATAWTAARLTRESLVAEVHRALVRALESGETMETFRGRIQPWLERRGWRPPRLGGDVPTRLARIYRVNMRTAHAAGQWERILRTRDLMPYLVYTLGPSREHRDQHVAWEGLILPATAEWWNTHFPPNGWGCRCRVRQVTARERERLLARGGYRSDEPEVETVTWVHPRDPDDRRDVAEGIDPGWDYNPGAHRTLGVHRALLEGAEATLSRPGRLPGVARPVRERIVRRRIRDYLAGPGFRWLMERPRGRLPPRWDRASRRDPRRPPVEEDAVPVAVLGPRQMEALGATRAVVRLEASVADKQWRRHGPGARALSRRIPLAWYADIQEMLDRLTPTRNAQGRWEYFDRAGGRKLVVGVDERGGYPLVISLHPSRGKKLGRTAR